MKAVVLAAGKGTRLYPLTKTRQKSMIPLAGKPILYHTLSAVKKLGVRKIVMIVGDFREQVEGFFGDGEELGLKIEYVYQDKPRGTAHAIGLASELVNESFFAINGDIVFDHDSLRGMKSMKGKNVVAAAKVTEPSEYGVLKMDKKKLLDIVEKPPRGKEPSDLANAGIYLFEPEVFDEIKKVKKSVRGEYELTDAIKKLSRVEVFGLKGYYNDVGRPWELLDANEFVMGKIKHRVEGELGRHVVLDGNVVVEKGTVVTGHVYIRGPVYLGKDCEIGPNCYVRDNVSLGDRVRIGRAVEIKNSIILHDTKAEHLAYIGDSLVGKDCNFGAGTKIANLRFDDKPVKVKIKDAVVDSGRRKLGVIMGDYCKTGINSCFMPGVKVGPNSQVGPGVVVYEDVAPNTRVVLKQHLSVQNIY